MHAMTKAPKAIPTRRAIVRDLAIGSVSVGKCHMSWASDVRGQAMVAFPATSLSTTSLAGESGRALLEERRHSLLVVCHSARHVLEVRFVLERFLEIALPRGVERALRERDRAGCTRSEAGGNCVRLAREVRSGHDPAEETESFCVNGADRIAEQRDFGSLCRTDQSRKEPGRAAVRNEPHMPERKGERRGI